MAGQKKNLRYPEETPWFPKYYIGWIGIGNCGQKTSNIYQDSKLLVSVVYFAKPDKLVYGPFGKSNMDSTLHFCPRQSGKKWMYH